MKTRQDYSVPISILVVILLSMFFATSTPKLPANSQGHDISCVCPPMCVQHDCSGQARMQVVPFPFSPFLLLCLATKSLPNNHRRDWENITQRMEILQNISYLFQAPCELPEPSLPSISDLHLFPSWPHTSLHQCLLSPPSVPTKSSQLKPFFVWSKIIQVPELFPGVSEGFHIKFTLNKNCNSV